MPRILQVTKETVFKSEEKFLRFKNLCKRILKKTKLLNSHGEMGYSTLPTIPASINTDG